MKKDSKSNSKSNAKNSAKSNAKNSAKNNSKEKKEDVIEIKMDEEGNPLIPKGKKIQSFIIPGVKQAPPRGRKPKIAPLPAIPVSKNAISDPIIPSVLEHKREIKSVGELQQRTNKGLTIPQAKMVKERNEEEMQNFLFVEKQGQSKGEDDLKKTILHKPSLVLYISTNEEMSEIEISDEELHDTFISLAKNIKKEITTKYPNYQVKATLSFPKPAIGKRSLQSMLSYNLSTTKENGDTLSELKIDLYKRSVSIDGTPKKLTVREFDLLLLLIELDDKEISREEILSRIWKLEPSGDNIRTVDVHIRRLRKKLGDNLLVQTIRGYGYKLNSKSNIKIIE
jgi:hypothetical protein